MVNRLQKNALHDQIVGGMYAYRLQALEEICVELLEEGQRSAWELTLHGVRHVRNVLVNLSEFKEHLAWPLSEPEAFLLASAALLHDTGMLPFKREDAELVDDRAWQRAVRETHARRSGEFVTRFFRNKLRYPLRPDHITSIRTLVSAHLMRSVRAVPETAFADGEEIRLRLMAALLRLADVCDVTNQRNSLLFEVLSLPSTSFVKWAKMEFVSKVNVQREGTARYVVVHCTVPRHRMADYEAVLSSLVLGKIRSEFLDSRPYLQARGGLQVSDVRIDVTAGSVESPVSSSLLSKLLLLAHAIDRVLSGLSPKEKAMLRYALTTPRTPGFLAERLGTTVKYVENRLAELCKSGVIRENDGGGAYGVPLAVRAQVRDSLRLPREG